MQLKTKEKSNKMQLKNKKKIIEKDKIVYLKDGINELLEIYPKPYSKQSKTVLETIAKNESSINCNNLPYKIRLFDGKLHEFFKKYGTLYSLLKNLVTIKNEYKQCKCGSNIVNN